MWNQRKRPRVWKRAATDRPDHDVWDDAAGAAEGGEAAAAEDANIRYDEASHSKEGGYVYQNVAPARDV